jgi:hypothetical protein
VTITDRGKERLNRTVNVAASCSEHALRTCPGIPSDPAALSVDLILKTLLTFASESGTTQSSGLAGALMHGSLLFLSMHA